MACSFAAAVAFVLFFSRIRPKILVSDRVAHYIDDRGVKRYALKVLNKARRPAINLKAELHVVEHEIVKGGPIYCSHKVHLIKSELLGLPAYDKNDKEYLYAFRFGTEDDLESLWGDDEKSFLRFRLFATDSLSGFSKVFTRMYYTKKHTFKEGDFARGETFEIA